MPPVVIAHRGASAHEPEHTAAAYRAALAAGADGWECDVRLTADQHLVLAHDRTVARTTGSVGNVSEMELADLRALDWGSWRGLPDDTDGPDRHGLLTLTDFLEQAIAAARPLELLIETKHPTRHGAKVERRLVEVLDRLGIRSGAHPLLTVRVMSFSYIAMQRMRTYAPGVRLVQLVDRLSPAVTGGSLPPGVETLGADIALLRRDPGIVADQHARGHEVYAWTVDDPADVQRCIDLGVDGIITNRPAEVLEQVRVAGSV
jgi:glycerophosphoryl diester phosphodiesterase